MFEHFFEGIWPGDLSELVNVLHSGRIMQRTNAPEYPIHTFATRYSISCETM